MEFLNPDEVEATLIQGPVNQSKHGVCILAKKTRVLDPKLASPEPDFIWPICQQELKTDLATFSFEHHFPLSKMDVMVVGFARAPQKKPLTIMEVSLSIGPQWIYRQGIFGDRVWRKKMLGFEKSDPTPFVEMPLTLANAYGGSVDLPNGEIKNIDNPEGKGYIIKGGPIEGVSLPNIERVTQLIEKPEDEPSPTCMAPYPLAGALRYRDKIGQDGTFKEFEPSQTSSYYGQAHPDLMIERPEPGTDITVKGMDHDRDLHFSLDPCPFQAELNIEGNKKALKFTTDAMVIFPHLNRVSYRYRAATDFILEARQTRTVTLREVSS